MSELPHLPAFGPEPVFVADDVAFDGVVARAVTRRRQRGTAAFSACVAASVTAVVLVSSGDYGRASLEPAIQNPVPTVSTSPTHSRVEFKLLTVPTTRPESAPDPLWGLSAETVTDDAPGEDCVEDTVHERWCFRYRGPDGAVSGAFVTFTAELCRLPVGTLGPHLEFYNEVELSLLVYDPGRVPGRYGEIPHGSYKESTRTFEAGTCRRWTAQWNGISEAGAPLPPGTYKILADVRGYVRYAPAPGRTPEPVGRGFSHRGEFVVS